MKNKWLRNLLLVSVLLASFNAPSALAAPYEGYNYSYWGDPVASPHAYLPDRSIEGAALGIGNFNAPEDLFVANDKVYVMDSGNSRIVILDKNWDVIRIIDGFDNNAKRETFTNAQGIFASETGEIYVADTDNSRIVVLTEAGDLIRMIGAPKSEVLREGFEFFPKKVSLDKAKRIYVVGKGVFDGIMEFDPEGEFNGFLGTNRVRFNAIDYFWKVVSTQKQRDQMEQFVPTEFTNLDISDDGFIYAANADAYTWQPLKKLNPTGFDVLRREGYASPRGDLRFRNTVAGPGNSVFTDIVVGENGMYSGLDIRKGRIFTYDEDGNLLYIFGQYGVQDGTFKTPAALDRIGDKFIVLDKGYNRISVFEPTAFGRSVNEAVGYHYNGKEDLSAKAWEKVLRLDANYEIAYIGIGKAKLRQGLHKESLYYFKNGMSRYYYSKAYQMYRKEWMRQHFGTFMTGFTILAIALIILRVWIGRKKEAGAHA